MRAYYDPRYKRLVQELANARRDAGLTQSQAAKTMGWRRTLISNIECGQRRIDILEVHALSKLYRIDFARLEKVLR